jgi:hypothetical protein
MTVKKFKGKWKITAMDQWDVELGWYIEFDGKGDGSFHFICVNAYIDYRMNSDPRNNRAEFTFHGDDEGDEIFGRGWAEIDGVNLQGFLCFHQGEESGFKALMMKSPKSINRYNNELENNSA